MTWLLFSILLCYTETHIHTTQWHQAHLSSWKKQWVVMQPFVAGGVGRAGRGPRVLPFPLFWEVSETWPLRSDQRGAGTTTGSWRRVHPGCGDGSPSQRGHRTKENRPSSPWDAHVMGCRVCGAVERTVWWGRVMWHSQVRWLSDPHKNPLKGLKECS